MEVEALISQLSQVALSADATVEQKTAWQDLADELLALQSIYALDDPSALEVVSEYHSTSHPSSPSCRGSTKTRLVLKIPLDLSGSSLCSSDIGTHSASTPLISLRLSITLPGDYPISSTAPQLQLLDRFIGQYEVDSRLFGQVLRTFFHQDQGTSLSGVDGAAEGIRWQRGEVVLFEGCESVKERVEQWYKEQKSKDDERRKKDGRAGIGQVVANLAANNDDKIDEGHSHAQFLAISAAHDRDNTVSPVKLTSLSSSSTSEVHDETLSRLISTKTWISTAALVDRKSTFIGHAIRLDRPEEVPLLLHRLLNLYPRMEKATHPLIRAWVCSTQDKGMGKGRIIHRDCDDDGESAAGGRLAHLLEMLHLENALVVVTRYYGGIHLGADRFKLINRVGREALELAGLLQTNHTTH